MLDLNKKARTVHWTIRAEKLLRNKRNGLGWVRHDDAHDLEPAGWNAERICHLGTALLAVGWIHLQVVGPLALAGRALDPHDVRDVFLRHPLGALPFGLFGGHDLTPHFFATYFRRDPRALARF